MYWLALTGVDKLFNYLVEYIGMKYVLNKVKLEF